jgi:hypothetical protein
VALGVVADVQGAVVVALASSAGRLSEVRQNMTIGNRKSLTTLFWLSSIGAGTAIGVVVRSKVPAATS